MATLKKLLDDQARATEKRHKKVASSKKKREDNSKLGGDWREIEGAERVFRRMVALGLDNVAGQLIGSESVNDSVDSGLENGGEVSLLERIIEENDLLSSRFLHIGSRVSRAVGRILIRENGRTVGFGTGFMISPALMMTNNHVLTAKAAASSAKIEFDYYERRSGAATPSVVHDIDSDSFFYTNKKLDFTIVAVRKTSADGQPLESRGWIPLIEASGKALVGEPVNIIQHPGGEPQQIVIKSNHITAVVDDFLHYEADTEPGSSGSPVFNMQWELAALHHSGVPKRDGEKNILLMDGSKWNGSRSTAHLIHWVANEGVRISSIVDTVREELKNDIESGLFEAAVAEGMGIVVPPQAATSPKPLPALPQQEPPRATKFEMSDRELDQLSENEVAQIIAELEHQTLESGALERRSKRPTLVAEGDSWFDYSLAGLDIIDCLRKFYDYQIYNVGNGGDTLDNMAWGTEYKKRRWRREPPPLLETLNAVKKHKPPVVLLSGGGNDVAGDELGSYLNHKSSGKEALRKDYLEYMVNIYYRGAYEHIIESIWDVDPNTKIITHGYGYAQPDGRAVIRALGLSFVGPWLRPAFTAKGYTEKHERQSIVKVLMDSFNSMLSSLAGDDARIHYIDLRSVIQSRDWENELHLTNSAYRRVAGEFDAVIRRVN